MQDMFDGQNEKQGIPDVVLHVPDEAIGRITMYKPGDRQVLPSKKFKLMQPGILVVDVILVKEEGQGPKCWRHAMPEPLRISIRTILAAQ